MEAEVIIEKPTPAQLNILKVREWPIWSKAESTFNWYYDSNEQCYLIDGEVMVTAPSGQYTIKAGDLVTFKKGLSCSWNIKKAVVKHYNFF